MGGIFSAPKPPKPQGPSKAELDAIARRERQAEQQKARESREIAARKRVRRGATGLMTGLTARTDDERQQQTTLGPGRNPR